MNLPALAIVIVVNVPPIVWQRTPQTPPKPKVETPAPVAPADAEALPVPGFGDAVLYAPRAATAKPVMVVAHGHGMPPDDMCRDFHELVGDKGFVLCPRGTPIAGKENAFTHGTELPQEVDADIAALRARYGARVDAGPMIYVGYSQSAYLAPSVVMREPSRFTRAIVIEGNGVWNEKKFAEAGGKRMMFACGQASCDTGNKPVVARFDKAGVPAKELYSPGAGHVWYGPVMDQIKANWAWFVDGDVRWGGRPPPPPRSGGSSV
jgi:predicted esterase